nr:DUF1361 domain-containing protein [Bacteroidota bacterium]
MLQNKSKNYLIVLALITVFNIIVLYARNAFVGDTTYNFLRWNLFLALVPLLVAVMLQYFLPRVNKWIIAIGCCVWLLFYPNSPYMISDLIHVDKTDSIILYDTLIIFSFSMLAIFYGFYSLKIIHLIFAKWMSIAKANMLIIFCIVLSSFGIYLGRVLRLNSWDIFHNPMGVFHTVIDHLFPFSKNPTTYAIIFIFSTIQFILLIMMKDMNEIEDKHFVNAKTAHE